MTGVQTCALPISTIEAIDRISHIGAIFRGRHNLYNHQILVRRVVGILRKGGKGPVDSIELITIQYVSGTADVHSCEEETFTYLR